MSAGDLPEPVQRAVAEYRAAHPEDDHLPDEVIGNTLMVRSRALGLALSDLGTAIAGEIVKRKHWLPWLVAAWIVAFAAVIFLMDDPFRCTANC